MPTATSAHRTVHTRHTRLRRGAPGSATAEGTRSSGDSEVKSEDSEVMVGLVNSVLLLDNRFAVLPPKEPAPGIQDGRNSTLSLSPSLRREQPITSATQTDILPTDPPSSKEETKTSSAVPPSKRRPVPKLARRTPPIAIEANQQPSALAVAGISSKKPRAQSSRLVLQMNAQAARSSKVPSTSTSISPDFSTVGPPLSFLAPHDAPSLPLPPIPPDPMAIPTLATLPIPPSLELKHFTSPKSSGPRSSQFSSPTRTSLEIFHGNDPMRHIVKSTSGKIFWMAAEIAAANERSTMKPVGNVLVPGHAKRFGEVKGKVDRKKLDRKSKDCVDSQEDSESESESESEEGGEGEEWQIL